MKRIYICKGTKRSIVASVLDGTYTIERAAFIVRVQPTTIKRWLKAFGPDALCEASLREQASDAQAQEDVEHRRNGYGAEQSVVYPHEEF